MDDEVHMTGSRDSTPDADIAAGQPTAGPESAIRAFLAVLARSLPALFPDRHTGRCGCPLCCQAEWRARVRVGMPLRHPERITRDLPDEQKELLALIADGLWPDDEYIAITETPRQAPGGGPESVP